MLRKCVVDRPFCNGKGSLSVRQTAELKTASVTINHMLAFRMAAASGAPVTIVLEDDAELRIRRGTRLQLVSNIQRSNCSVLV